MNRWTNSDAAQHNNVTGLQWWQVDLARRLARVHPDQARARRAIAVPLMGGWESPEMVRRYAHRAADHLSPFAERLKQY